MDAGVALWFLALPLSKRPKPDTIGSAEPEPPADTSSPDPAAREQPTPQ